MNKFPVGWIWRNQHGGEMKINWRMVWKQFPWNHGDISVCHEVADICSHERMAIRKEVERQLEEVK